MYGDKNVIIFWHMELGVVGPYVLIIWSKMLLIVIDAFHSIVGEVVVGAIFEGIIDVRVKHVVHSMIDVACSCSVVIVLLVL